MESHNIIKEIVQEYGLQSVSIKTNIPTDTLKKLIDGNFEGFSKMQVLGFAKIFEREFDANLAEFKNDVREYYVKNVETTNKPVLSNSVDTSSDGFFSKLFFYLFIAALLYGAWYIYQNFYKKETTQTVVAVENQYFDIEKNKSTLDDKKESIYSIKVLQTKKKTTHLAELNTTTTQETNLSTLEDNSSDSAIEANTTALIDNADTIASDEKNTTIDRKSITLIPSQKLWFRLTNRATHRYKTYSDQVDSHQFDLSTDWLMVVKKGEFTFVDNNEQKEYNADTLSYFKIDKASGVTQLSQEEYKKLGGYSAK
ncbi:MAG: hypothetical protein JXQ76_00150 [Campylobacterales bacterium]|nr:hypothetical protein [Campylobacterales bacterium]